MFAEKKKIKKYQYSQEDLDNAVNAVKSGDSVRHAAKQFNVPKTTLGRKIQATTPSKLKINVL